MASQEERDRIMAEYLASVERDEDDEDEDDDDDDDDDEAEFHPGIDDVTDDDEDDYQQDDDDDDDDDDSEAVRWKGKLSFANGTLKYSGVTSEGNSFLVHSKKSESLYWNWYCPTATKQEDQSPRMRTISLEGTPSNVSITITATDQKQQQQQQQQHSNKNLKDDQDRDENDGKMAAKMPPTEGKKQATSAALPTWMIYSVYGQGDGFELYGELLPHALSHPDKQTDDEVSTSVPLECRYRSTTQHQHAARAAAVATAVSDDDDDIVDADQGVDYNELIALHEDAGMTVGEIRKRFGRRADATANEESNKKAKTIPEVEKDDDDDDDDEDVGF
jgi:hypothetical protein